jgi:hypothetical protein
MLHYCNIVNKDTKNYISNCFIIWKLVHQPVIKDPVKISSSEKEKIGKNPEFENENSCLQKGNIREKSQI